MLQTMTHPKLYQGKTAARFETDRLLKRLEKLRKDKAEHEKQLQGINDEISTVQKRLDELAKQ
jgi:predicted nuclease with TOPRIM domain